MREKRVHARVRDHELSPRPFLWDQTKNRSSAMHQHLYFINSQDANTISIIGIASKMIQETFFMCKDQFYGY
jgi:hypothetical protein